jgi:hypothetical protein
MIKVVLNILNLNGSSLQIRSKQRATSAGTQKCGMSFELSKFQSGTIKQANNMRMHEPQIRIINHDHFAIVTWLSTHIIVFGSKRSNFRKSIFKFKIQFLVLTKDLAKQLVLIAKGILKLDNSQGKTFGGMNHHLHQSRRCVTMTCP